MICEDESSTLTLLPSLHTRHLHMLSPYVHEFRNYWHSGWSCRISLRAWKPFLPFLFVQQWQSSVETIKNHLLEQESADDRQSHFCSCRIEALVSSVLDEDSRKNLAPDTSFITEQERNIKMKGTSDVERGWAGETSTIWYSRRRCASPWPCSSLYAKSYPTLNNVCVCWARVKRKPSASCQSRGRVRLRPPLSAVSAQILYVVKRIDILDLS